MRYFGSYGVFPFSTPSPWVKLFQRNTEIPKYVNEINETVVQIRVGSWNTYPTPPAGHANATLYCPGGRSASAVPVATKAVSVIAEPRVRSALCKNWIALTIAHGLSFAFVGGLVYVPYVVEMTSTTTSTSATRTARSRGLSGAWASGLWRISCGREGSGNVTLQGSSLPWVPGRITKTVGIVLGVPP